MSREPDRNENETEARSGGGERGSYGDSTETPTQGRGVSVLTPYRTFPTRHQWRYYKLWCLNCVSPKKSNDQIQLRRRIAVAFKVF